MKLEEEQVKKAKEILKVVDLLMDREEIEERYLNYSYDTDLYDPEYKIFRRCTDEEGKYLVVVESKFKNMRIECEAGQIIFAEGISVLDTEYWQKKDRELAGVERDE